MPQQDQHLTTEQLSAFLDQQLTRAEQASCNIHLQDCKPCQSVLDDLRQTVHLLRSLPQLEVPRSFALPADFNIPFYANSNYHNSQMDYVVDTRINGKKEQQVKQATTTSPRKLPIRLRQTLRMVSALAAVIGLFFVISGFITTPQATVSTAAMPTLGSAKPSIGAPSQQPAPADASGKSNSDTLAPISRSTTQAVKTPVNTPEPQPTATQTAPVETNSTVSTTRWPILLFLDFNQPGVRLLTGILLAILGSMGFILFAQRQKQRTRPIHKSSA